MLTTSFTEKVGCSVPLQQAGMGGVATADLAVAVAEAGALGMIGGARVPAERMAQMLEDAARRTAGTIGVNFLMPFLERDAVEAAASRCRLVEFFYADPDPSLVDLVHAGGALAAWQVGSVEEAVAAVRAGCDLVVAQGVEAGGHVRGRIGVLPLLADVLDAVEVPVIASGGIGSARAMAAVLAAGAAAARLGTRFLATPECNIHPGYVDALLGAGAGDTELTETFSVMWPNAPHRVLRSSIDAARAFEGDIVAELPLGDVVFPLPPRAVPAPTRGTTGTIEAMALYAGQTVGRVERIQPAAEIVHELAEGAEELLRAAAGIIRGG